MKGMTLHEFGEEFAAKLSPLTFVRLRHGDMAGQVTAWICAETGRTGIDIRRMEHPGRGT
jgi:hypothetical protein